MEYNEKHFKALANKLALGLWVLILTIMTAEYGVEVLSGSRTVPFYIVLCLLGWGPVVINLILMKIKGKDTKAFAKHMSYFVNYGFTALPKADTKHL